MSAPMDKKSQDKLLESLVDELEGRIRCDEGQYASHAICDLHDALNQSDNKIKTAYEWLQGYKTIT